MPPLSSSEFKNLNGVKVKLTINRDSILHVDHDNSRPDNSFGHYNADFDPSIELRLHDYDHSSFKRPSADDNNCTSDHSY